jgi:hypothetical protein
MAYVRVMCPAAAGKLRCPLVEASLNLSFERPGLPDPPASPPRCWRQRTITVPPSVNDKIQTFGSSTLADFLSREIPAA